MALRLSLIHIYCPKAEIGHCVNCRPTCAITTGFSGAGAFSDGKLSLSYEMCIRDSLILSRR